MGCVILNKRTAGFILKYLVNPVHFDYDVKVHVASIKLFFLLGERPG